MCMDKLVTLNDFVIAAPSARCPAEVLATLRGKLKNLLRFLRQVPPASVLKAELGTLNRIFCAV